jgi:RNA polymerase sigma-70 factor (ECF subfamily)
LYRYGKISGNISNTIGKIQSFTPSMEAGEVNCLGSASETNDIREKRLEQWIAQYGNAILRTCFVYLSDAGQAEDAMQDTFLKAWHCMEQFERRKECSEMKWLMRIAVNVCRDYQRSKWFRHVDMSRVLTEIPVHFDEVLPEDRVLLMDIFRMPEKYKQVILLYYYHEMTLQEVADALSISRATVQNRLHKAKGLLRLTLTGRDIEDGQPSQAGY